MAPPDFVDRLLALWNDPPTGDGARQAFLALYTDPVRVNGVELAIDELVARARQLGATLSNRSTELLSRVDDAERVAIAFRIHATHSGPLSTPLGEVAATGKTITVQVIDVLTLREGRICEIWMVADTFGQLLQLDALSLRKA
jgi:predicted ester cyclase